MTGTVLDLFAGPGGWDQGALPLGLHPIGIEWDDAACRTGKAAGHHRVRADVASLATEPMLGKVTGLIASPPCQTFSMAGNGKGRDALPELQDAVEKVWNGATPQSVCPADLDPRSVLVLEPIRYARDLRPEWIACEQVPAVLPIWQAFAVVLRMNGYSAWVGVLNAADYGVPQTRQRAILIASRVRTVAPPAPTHTKGGEESDLFGDQLDAWVPMARALGYDPGVLLPSQGGPTSFDRTVPRRAAEEPALTLSFGHNAASWVWHRPATTVVGSFSPDIIAAPGYRLKESRQNAEGSVRVTLQEAAALQSFPAGYPWHGSKTKQWEQVGNAVPPRLALHVLAAVLGVPVPIAQDVAA